MVLGIGRGSRLEQGNGKRRVGVVGETPSHVQKITMGTHPPMTPVRSRHSQKSHATVKPVRSRYSPPWSWACKKKEPIPWKMVNRAKRIHKVGCLKSPPARSDHTLRLVRARGTAKKVLSENGWRCDFRSAHHVQPQRGQKQRMFLAPNTCCWARCL